MVVAISIVLGIAALVVMAVAYASCIVAKETDEAMPETFRELTEFFIARQNTVYSGASPST